MGCRWRTSARPLARLAADALRRRVGVDELRMLRLERAQLAHQAVVGRVVDRRGVVDEVRVLVSADLRAQLGDAGGGIVRHPSPSRIVPSSAGVLATASAPAAASTSADATPHVTPTALQPAATAASMS